MKQGRISKVVKIGASPSVPGGNLIYIGGNHPVVVQTMWKEKLSINGLEDAALRINALEAMGCGLIRFAVPDIKAADVLGSLAQMVKMPLCADIHFDHEIALRCMDFPIAKIRINPGNIGGKDKVLKVLEKAVKRDIPLRIGVNAGSLPKDLQKLVLEGMQTADALVEAAQREIAICKEYGFTEYLVSMKASGIADTISANQILADRTDAPLHIGVTEAGPLIAGVARSTAALLTLLKEGIGDTIRVSLSDTMENEIIAAREIIGAACQINRGCQMNHGNERLSLGGVNIISCPRCGRYGFDTHGFTSRWMSRLYSIKKDITIAIMGCEVNGPAEAKHADLGITGAGEKVLIFKHGEIIKTITAAEADKTFNEELEKL